MKNKTRLLMIFGILFFGLALSSAITYTANSDAEATALLNTAKISENTGCRIISVTKTVENITQVQNTPIQVFFHLEYTVNSEQRTEVGEITIDNKTTDFDTKKAIEEACKTMWIEKEKDIEAEPIMVRIDYMQLVNSFFNLKNNKWE